MKFLCIIISLISLSLFGLTSSGNSLCRNTVLKYASPTISIKNSVIEIFNESIPFNSMEPQIAEALKRLTTEVEENLDFYLKARLEEHLHPSNAEIADKRSRARLQLDEAYKNLLAFTFHSKLPKPIELKELLTKGREIYGVPSVSGGPLNANAIKDFTPQMLENHKIKFKGFSEHFIEASNLLDLMMNSNYKKIQESALKYGKDFKGDEELADAWVNSRMASSIKELQVYLEGVLKEFQNLNESLMSESLKSKKKEIESLIKRSKEKNFTFSYTDFMEVSDTLAPEKLK